MHAWFAAFSDTRYSVVAPIIGVQVVCLVNSLQLYLGYIDNWTFTDMIIGFWMGRREWQVAGSSWQHKACFWG